MENALYYTFSTIAQALAAAVALLGAAILVRLQQLSATLATSSAHMIRAYLRDAEARRLVDASLFEELAAHLEGREKTRDVGPDAHAAAEHAFHAALASRSTLMRRWRAAMVVSGLTIVGAVLALAITPWVVAGGWAAYALGVGIAALVGTLYAQGRVLWSAV